MRHRVLLLTSLLLLPALACATDNEDEGSESNADETGGECTPPSLDLRNNTGNTIEGITFVKCDMSDGNDYPLPPPGLADGEGTTIPFPGPGCWVLGYEGEGCFEFEPVTPPELDCGETYAWTLTEDNHICQG